MGCVVCDTGPIAETVLGYDLCWHHLAAVKKCYKCESVFLSPSGLETVCRICRYIPPVKHGKYNGYAKSKKCAFCGNQFTATSDRQSTCCKFCSDNYQKEQRDIGRLIIFDRDKFRCFYCGKSTYGDCEELHVDHIYPKSLGGENIASNLVTSCAKCNLNKKATVLKNISIVLEEVARRNNECEISPHQAIKLPKRYYE